MSLVFSGALLDKSTFSPVFIVREPGVVTVAAAREVILLSSVTLVVLLKATFAVIADKLWPSVMAVS